MRRYKWHKCQDPPKCHPVCTRICRWKSVWGTERSEVSTLQLFLHRLKLVKYQLMSVKQNVRIHFITSFKIGIYILCWLLPYCKIGHLQRWENNSKKYPFKAKLWKYHISAINFFSPEWISQWGKMTLGMMYTVSQPEKICNNIFAVFQIDAPFLPDVYFDKRV